MKRSTISVLCVFMVTTQLSQAFIADSLQAVVGLAAPALGGVAGYLRYTEDDAAQRVAIQIVAGAGIALAQSLIAACKKRYNSDSSGSSLESIPYTTTEGRIAYKAPAITNRIREAQSEFIVTFPTYLCGNYAKVIVGNVFGLGTRKYLGDRGFTKSE